jgi:hypothetical protein
MYARDIRDIIGGAALIAVGVLVAVNATLNYPLGMLRHMGPGMFPAMLGWLLAGLGVLVLLPALFRAGELPRPEMRPLLTVCAAVAVFGMTIRTLGVAPAVIATVLVATLADDKLGPIGAVVLAAVMAVLSVLIFIYALGMPLQIVAWPVW